MVHIIVCNLRGERQQILSEETSFSVEKLKEHLGVLGQGCFLSSILRDKVILDDATDLAGFTQPVELNLIQHPSQWSPMLLSAAHRQDISEVDSALRNFADPNSQDDNGWTALCFAALHGNMNMESRPVFDVQLPRELSTRAVQSAVHVWSMLNQGEAAAQGRC